MACPMTTPNSSQGHCSLRGSQDRRLAPRLGSSERSINPPCPGIFGISCWHQVGKPSIPEWCYLHDGRWRSPNEVPTQGPQCSRTGDKLHGRSTFCACNKQAAWRWPTLPHRSVSMAPPPPRPDAEAALGTASCATGGVEMSDVPSYPIPPLPQIPLPSCIPSLTSSSVQCGLMHIP